MTATPRLYTANAKEKATARQVAVYSMDDEGIYGPEFYRMSFADAVRGEYLSEYEVAIVAVSDGLFATLAGDFVAEHADTGVNVKDVVRLLGCWDALADPTSRGPTGRVTGTLNPNHAARRAHRLLQQDRHIQEGRGVVAEANQCVRCTNGKARRDRRHAAQSQRGSH